MRHKDALLDAKSAVRLVQTGSSAPPSSPAARPPMNSAGQSVGTVASRLGSPGQDSTRASPLELLIRGEEQVVVIPWAVILEKVMKSLPGKKGPVYHWMKSGVSGFHVCIELDCTGTRYSVVPVGCCSSELKVCNL